MEENLYPTNCPICNRGLRQHSRSLRRHLRHAKNKSCNDLFNALQSTTVPDELVELVPAEPVVLDSLSQDTEDHALPFDHDEPASVPSPAHLPIAVTQPVHTNDTETKTSNHQQNDAFHLRHLPALVSLELDGSVVTGSGVVPCGRVDSSESL